MKQAAFSFGKNSACKFKMADINKNIAIAEEIQQLQKKKRESLNKQKNEARKARIRRLIERGAILESFLEQPDQYGNDQIKDLLEIALRPVQAQEFMREVVSGNPET